MSPSVYPIPVAVSAFMICRGLCAYTEMLYVSFGSKRVQSALPQPMQTKNCIEKQNKQSIGRYGVC